MVGRKFWAGMIDLFKKVLVEEKKINVEDIDIFNLFYIPEEEVTGIYEFYCKYLFVLNFYLCTNSFTSALEQNCITPNVFHFTNFFAIAYLTKPMLLMDANTRFILRENSRLQCPDIFFLAFAHKCF